MIFSRAALLTAAGLALSTAPAMAGPAPQDPKTELEAFVVDQRGVPIEGAGLLIEDAATIASARALTNPLAVTNSQGGLKVTVVAGGADARHALLVAKGKTSVRLAWTGTDSGVWTGQGAARRRIVDLGTVVLREGFALRGLVRSTKGEPVVGARVHAIDIFRSRHLNLSIHEGCESFATTDAKGVFTLAGVPVRGVSVRITADGFHDFSVDYANKFTPVVVQLTPGGSASGTVVDAAGKPAGGVAVWVHSEHSPSPYSVRADAAGRFAVPLRFPGRYRLSAGDPKRKSAASGWTAVLSGSRSDLRIAIPQPKVPEIAADAGVEIRAKAKRDGKPVTAFAAVCLFVTPQTWRFNKGLLERYFTSGSQESDASGLLVLPGPPARRPRLGRLLLKARGYAPRVLDLEFPAAGPRKQLTVDLEPECVLAGIVVDEKTGEPLEGALVRVEQDQLRSDTVSTDENGKFRIRGLAHGKQRVIVARRDRPDASLPVAKLAAGESRPGVKVKMPRGATLSGELVGAKLGTGWQVKLEQHIEQTVEFLPTSLEVGGPGSKAPVVVGADGKFRFTGVADGKYRLTLLIPYPLGSLEIPVESVKVFGDETAKFDISDRLPAWLRGKVKATGAPIAPGRLLVIAHNPDPRMRGALVPMTPQVHGTRSLVAPDGAYALPLPAGKHRIKIVDIATGVVLHQGDVMSFKSGETKEHDVPVPLAMVIGTLVPREEGGRVIAHRVEVRVHHSDAERQQFARINGIGGVHFDSGVGVALQPGQTEFRLVLPAAKEAQLLVRSAAYELDPTKSVYNFPPIGEETVHPETEKIGRVEIGVVFPTG